MWVYFQKTGALLHGTTKVADCYSGFGPAKNDPLQERQPGLGPIPRGAYLIGSEADDDKHGPVALHLVPQTGTETFGRSAFMVHGDSIEHPGAASHGCIIAPREVRNTMANGHDKLLVVLSGTEAA